MQFRFLSREEAKDYLRNAPLIAENVGDRIAAWRRMDYVTTAEERRAAQLDAQLYGRPLKTDIDGNPITP